MLCQRRGLNRVAVVKSLYFYCTHQNVLGSRRRKDAAVMVVEKNCDKAQDADDDL